MSLPDRIPAGQHGHPEVAPHTHNLTRAAATMVGHRHALARPATIRRHLINLAARIARHARGIIIHLPEYWPWQHQWRRLFAAVHAPPPA